MNLEYYNCPRLQIRVVRILWMVPIYAVNSWLCLRFKDASFYIDPVRECYEAFVIYNFYMYLVTYLEDEVGDPVAYFSTKEQVGRVLDNVDHRSSLTLGVSFLSFCSGGAYLAGEQDSQAVVDGAGVF